MNYKAVPFDIGYHGDDIENIVLKCQAINYDKPVRVISEWVWCDLVLQDGGTVPDGLFPVIIYALNIHSDSSRRFKVGHGIRTSLLKKLHDDCIFESENTFYILLGKGFRKSVDIEVLSFMFFG